MPTEPNASQKPSSPLFAAIYDPATALVERTLLRPHREYLVANLDGTVLDLGAGTGAMFPYFESVATASTEFHAIEPDPYMRRQAAEKAKAQATPVRIESSPAEALSYDDESFDIVIASMVFCTIPDIESAVKEVARVLKPGGELRFFEHVIDDGWRAGLQSALAPLWKRLAGGCHLTRQTGTRLVADRSFDVVEIERLNLGVTPIRPFVRGRLRKRSVSPPRQRSGR
ncbi:class I SAM-dependent methyltransferase [Haloarcula japonica]|uniref:Type 11 methyltransferase n=1 Tax=Haloarcula japonica (strain ATCC 49778 / DSM 6131 / JCM 7785 / NBRC 101032 / NCIMB 13157 / TR-1) TaxID=1227453 RepID=M0L417_HALJT|nr:class I SAM-dependent methyltransferase [Haloarcula japonica]EMA27828.1 type 11 methyltransferase [Haloarcula japonica DSM 6131]